MQHTAPRPMGDELSGNPPRTQPFCRTLLDPQWVYATAACPARSSPITYHELAGTDRPEGDLRCRYQHRAVRIVVSIAHQVRVLIE
jgi:hypothetical protein